MNIRVLSAPVTTLPLVDSRDRPLRDLRLSVIDQCNLRCTYCMPRETFGPGYPFLRDDQRLTLGQLVGVASAFVDQGVRKIRLTGGEPLLRKGIEHLIERLAKLTTLEGQPLEIAIVSSPTK